MPTRYDIGLIVGIDLLTVGAIALLLTLIISSRKILATARQGHVTAPALITTGLLLLTMMLLKTPLSAQPGLHWWKEPITDSWDLNLTIGAALYPVITTLIGIALAVSAAPLAISIRQWLDAAHSTTSPELTNRQDLRRRYRMSRTEAQLAGAISHFLLTSEEGRRTGTIVWDRYIGKDSATTWFIADPVQDSLEAVSASLQEQFADTARIAEIAVDSSPECVPRIRIDWNLSELDAERYEPHGHRSFGYGPLHRLFHPTPLVSRPARGH